MERAAVNAIHATVDLESMQKLTAKLQKIGRSLPQVTGAILFREAEKIMKRSKEEFVPVEHGPLRASGKVLLPEMAGAQVSVTMGYGDASVRYAIAVHEHLSQHSPPSWVAAEAAGRHVQFHPAGHGPKYLERPLDEARSGLDVRLGQGIAAEIDRLAKA